MPTINGIPPISDYAHWNEDAERVWYEENKYDMMHPEVFEDYLYDPYDDRNWGDDYISEEVCEKTNRHSMNTSGNSVLFGPNGDTVADVVEQCDDCETSLVCNWNPEGYKVTQDSMPVLTKYGNGRHAIVFEIPFAVYERL